MFEILESLCFQKMMVPKLPKILPNKHHQDGSEFTEPKERRTPKKTLISLQESSGIFLDTQVAPKFWSMLHKILVKIAEANWIFKEFSFQCAQTLGPWKAQVLIHEKWCQRILFSENCSFADRIHWFTFFILINFCKDPSKKELNKYTDPHFNTEIL